MRLPRAPIWAFRAAWALLPLAVGPAVAGAIDGRSGAVRAVTIIGLWLGWALGLLASLVPVPAALTAVRLLAPGAPFVAVAAAFGGAGPLASGVAVLVALIAAVLAATAEVGGVVRARRGVRRREPLRAAATRAVAGGPARAAVGGARRRMRRRSVAPGITAVDRRRHRHRRRRRSRRGSRASLPWARAAMVRVRPGGCRRAGSARARRDGNGPPRRGSGHRVGASRHHGDRSDGECARAGDRGRLRRIDHHHSAGDARRGAHGAARRCQPPYSSAPRGPVGSPPRRPGAVTPPSRRPARTCR